MYECMYVCVYVCMYVCMSVTGLQLKYTITLVYILHCHVRTLCYNDDDNLGGPVTKTVDRLTDCTQDDKIFAMCARS